MDRDATEGRSVSARYRAGKRLWEPEDDARMRREFPDIATAELARRLGRTAGAVNARADKLGLHKSAAYLASPAACRLRRGDNIGKATQFKPGQSPANKGLRRPGWHRGRMKETQFRKGERKGVALKLWKPLGTERISKDGYLERKVNNDLPLQARWRAVHLVLWEEAHGKLPAGYAVTFVNGDKRDVRLDNLTLISRVDLMKRNSLHNLPAPLPHTIQLLGALNRQIRRRANAAQQDR